ncbi:cell surface A33 antigen-like [Narcine bancroftii]|uniref:cell surface A33 antigen-like n=1 Tax=Narcine bancroftii TaxID=1343680 RepID=UPI00383208EF
MLVIVALALVPVLTTLNAMTVEVAKTLIEIGRGDDLHFECNYKTTAVNKDNLNIEWIRLQEPQEGLIDVIQYFYDGIYSIGNLYKDRANFTGNVNDNDCSITIKKTQMTDSGTYVIEVKTPFDLQGDRKQTIEVIVLVPPSPPVCKIEGKSEIGQTVKLTCHSEEGSPAPVYTWQSYNSQNQPRSLPPMSTQEKDDLVLKNISVTTSGFFICTSTNKIRASTCNITLAVMPPSMNIGFYGGIIGGAVGVLIILGIIVYCCCCRDDEKRPEDYEMEEPHQEDEEPPEGVSRRTYHDDDPNEDGRSSPNSSARAPLAPPNKPTYVPENYEV